MPGNDKHQIPSSKGLGGGCKWGGKHTGGFDFIAKVSFLKLGSSRGVCCIVVLHGFVYVIIHF